MKLAVIEVSKAGRVAVGEPEYAAVSGVESQARVLADFAQSHKLRHAAVILTEGLLTRPTLKVPPEAGGEEALFLLRDNPGRLLGFLTEPDRVYTFVRHPVLGSCMSFTLSKQAVRAADAVVAAAGLVCVRVEPAVAGVLDLLASRSKDFVTRGPVLLASDDYVYLLAPENEDWVTPVQGRSEEDVLDFAGALLSRLPVKSGWLGLMNTGMRDLAGFIKTEFPGFEVEDFSKTSMRDVTRVDGLQDAVSPARISVLDFEALAFDRGLAYDARPEFSAAREYLPGKYRLAVLGFAAGFLLLFALLVLTTRTFSSVASAQAELASRIARAAQVRGVLDTAARRVQAAGVVSGLLDAWVGENSPMQWFLQDLASTFDAKARPGLVMTELSVSRLKARQYKVEFSLYGPPEQLSAQYQESVRGLVGLGYQEFVTDQKFVPGGLRISCIFGYPDWAVPEGTKGVLAPMPAAAPAVLEK
ncbi:hypothetical protein OH491_23985 [Termitidicoccus mucosus]|uniref:hypothetical protein n=1 Tax=Termitidicoccus mucosus TaxID=1184151 RepID=UPI0011AB8A08